MRRYGSGVWRDPGGRDAVPFNAVDCAAAPAPFPLSERYVYALDEAEESTTLNSVPVFPNPPLPLVVPFPLATQRTDFAVFSPYESGFVGLNLNVASSNPVPGGALADVRQSVVLTRYRQGEAQGPFTPATYSSGPQHHTVDGASCAGAMLCDSFPSWYQW